MSGRDKEDERDQHDAHGRHQSTYLSPTLCPHVVELALQTVIPTMTKTRPSLEVAKDVSPNNSPDVRRFSTTPTSVPGGRSGPLVILA